MSGATTTSVGNATLGNLLTQAGAKAGYGPISGIEKAFMAINAGCAVVLLTALSVALWVTHLPG